MEQMIQKKTAGLSSCGRFSQSFVIKLLSNLLNCCSVNSQTVGYAINYLGDRVSVLYRSLSLVTT